MVRSTQFWPYFGVIIFLHFTLFSLVQGRPGPLYSSKTSNQTETLSPTASPSSSSQSSVFARSQSGNVTENSSAATEEERPESHYSSPPPSPVPSSHNTRASSLPQSPSLPAGSVQPKSESQLHHEEIMDKLDDYEYVLDLGDHHEKESAKDVWTFDSATGGLDNQYFDPESIPGHKWPKMKLPPGQEPQYWLPSASHTGSEEAAGVDYVSEEEADKMDEKDREELKEAAMEETVVVSAMKDDLHSDKSIEAQPSVTVGSRSVQVVNAASAPVSHLQKMYETSRKGSDRLGIAGLVFAALFASLGVLAIVFAIAHLQMRAERMPGTGWKQIEETEMTTALQ